MPSSPDRSELPKEDSLTDRQRLLDLSIVGEVEQRAGLSDSDASGAQVIRLDAHLAHGVHLFLSHVRPRFWIADVRAARLAASALSASRRSRS